MTAFVSFAGNPTHQMPIVLDPDEAFAARYRSFVASAFDRFEFFGVDPLGVPRRHTFDRGYFAPTLVPHEPASGDPATAGERADRALAPLRRAVVRGVAGSGKTTLLRWLAWLAANAGPADEPAPVPFLVEFGRYNGTDLPSLEQLVAERLQADRPGGWVTSMLEAGRVVLLLDGLDEVAVSDRDRMESWLQEHLNLHRGIRCIVSTRPSIVDEQRWVDQGFRRLDLLPKISGFPTKVRLASLAGLRLESLWLSGDALRGEVGLPAGLQVRHLTLLAPTRGRVDFTAVRGVRSLILNRAAEQHELDALPELQRLIVVPAGR